MFKQFKQVSQSKVFQNVITIVIAIASILVGLETYPTIVNQHTSLFHFLDYTIQFIFTLEITIRILAHGNHPLRFFKSGSNWFDFIVTGLFYLPFGGSFVAVFRLVRIFRIFRLFTALPQLQIMVGALIKSVPSMGYVGLLLLLQFYIFAVIGTVEFGHIDPDNFGNLGQTMFTLFQIVTLEGWVEIYKGLGGTVVSTLYFISFILLGTMIVLNLFIGVITSGFDEVKKEIEEASEDETIKLSSDLIGMRKQLVTLNNSLERAITKSKKKKA